MKSTQLLSVVFSLIMFTGVTAGNAAFAESDDIDDILEDFCEMTLEEQSDILSEYDLDDYADKLAAICEIGDEDEREDSLEDVIDAMDLDTHDDETDDDSDDIIEDFEDCVEAGHPVMESYPEQCKTDDGQVFTNTDDDDDEHDETDDYYRYETDDDFDLDDLLDEYCEMTDEEQRQLLADHPRLAPFGDRLANYCEMSEDEQDAIDELIEEHGDKIRAELREYSKDYRMDYKKDMMKHLTNYCEMSDADRKAFVAENDKAEDHEEKMNGYCELDEDGKADFIEEHRDEYIAHMKEKMNDGKKHHMDYSKMCELSESDRALKIDDPEKLERLSAWCEMTPEEKEDYKKEHHGDAKMMNKSQYMENKKHHMDYSKMCELSESDRALKIVDPEKLERLSAWCEMTPEEKEDYKKEHHGDAKDEKKHELKMHLSENSDSIKEMIMEKRDLSDERREEIKMKYIEKHGELTDERKSELKMKFMDHMKTIKHKISDERKSDIHDRLAEMKAFKAELREKASEMTDKEKQQLREEFIEKAKDMRLAWISPHTQMTAGVDAAEVQCREGHSLVMKESNGAAMCLKANTALKMIERGIVVPAI